MKHELSIIALAILSLSSVAQANEYEHDNSVSTPPVVLAKPVFCATYNLPIMGYKGTLPALSNMTKEARINLAQRLGWNYQANQASLEIIENSYELNGDNNAETVELSNHERLSSYKTYADPKNWTTSFQYCKW